MSEGEPSELVCGNLNVRGGAFGASLREPKCPRALLYIKRTFGTFLRGGAVNPHKGIDPAPECWSQNAEHHMLKQY